MKQKYILETYDQIVKEIKNPRIVFDNDFVSFLQICSNESYLIYKVDFIKQNGTIKFNIKTPIHNLHPKTEEIDLLEIEPDGSLKNLIPIILQELNLNQFNTRFHWCSNDNNDEILYVLSDIEIEQLDDKTRFFLYCFQTVKNENEKIKKLNKETIFNFKSNERTEQYIHKKQYAIENLANRLIKDINPVNKVDIYTFSHNYDKKDCLKIVYIYLEKLLRFIEKEYNNFLNINIQMPYRSILIKEFEITDKLNTLKEILLDSNIDDNLLKLAYEPLLKIATIKIQEKITYYEFNYCSDYITILHNQLNSESITNDSVKERLFDLNFNSVNFLRYLVSDIQNEIEDLQSNIEKIDHLYKVLKNYNQKQTRNFVKYKKNLPDLKTQIISWIEEELEYLTKKIKLEANDIALTHNKEERIKFLTELSVAQLAYFFSILIETGIIKHKNQMDIFRFISDNFKTKNTDTISIDSIKVKYYNPETNTKQIIREKIIELLSFTKL